jgi:hypothetical protein
MRTKYAALNGHRHRIKRFIKTHLEPARKQEPARENILPPNPDNPPSNEPAKNNLPLFMEPVYKARDFDPL